MKSNFLVAFVAIMILTFLSLPAMAAEGGLRPWVKMNQGSFEPTSASAFEQCMLAAEKSVYDALTPSKCHLLKSNLEEGKCPELAVPDGTVFDFMTTRYAGKPVAEMSWVKQLGRDDDLATVCDLRDGVVAYFFRGETRSCNNLAFVLTPQKSPVPETVQETPVADTPLIVTLAPKKCQRLKNTVLLTNSSVLTALTSSALQNDCGFVSTGGGVYMAALPESSFTSGRRICDD